MTTAVDALRPIDEVEASPVPAADAVLDVQDLVDLYRCRDAARSPLTRRDLSLVERVVRTKVAQHVLARRVPLLVAELIEAAADDVGSQTLDGGRDGSQRRPSGVRGGEAVQGRARRRGARGARPAAGRHRVERAGPLRRARRLRATGLARPRGARGDGGHHRDRAGQSRHPRSAGPCHVAHRHGCRAAVTPAVRLRQPSPRVHHPRRTRSLPDEAGLEIIDAVLREKDGAPPSPSLFRQRLSRACLAADREAAERRRAARQRRRGAYAEIDPDGLGSLHVTNDADKIIAAMERVEAIARAARQGGDSRDLDTLRAEVITDILMFGWPSTSEMPASGDDDRSTSGCPRPAAGPEPRLAEQVLLADEARPESSAERSSVGRGIDRGPRRASERLRRPIRSASCPRGLVHPPRAAPGRQRPHHRAVHDRRRCHGCAVRGARLRLGGGRPRSRDHPQLGLDVAPARGRRRHRRGPQPRDQGLSTHRSNARARRGRRRQCRAPGCTVPASRCDLDHDIPWPQGATDVSNLSSSTERATTRTRTGTGASDGTAPTPSAGAPRPGAPTRPRPRTGSRVCAPESSVESSGETIPPRRPMTIHRPSEGRPPRRPPRRAQLRGGPGRPAYTEVTVVTEPRRRCA